MQFNNFGAQQNRWGSMNKWGDGFENGSMGNSFAGPFSAPGSGDFYRDAPGNYGLMPEPTNFGMSNGPTFSKAEIDGTNSFGANSVINGAMGNGGSGGGIFDGLNSFLKGAVGTKDAPGWGGMALGTVGGLASTYMGMKQYGLAKQSLAQNKAEYYENLGAQKKLTNSSLEARQEARVRSGSGYQSVGDYMKKYAV